MFDLKTLDVLIGVAFFFTFASLLSSAIREFVEACLNTRAQMLEQSLRELLNDDAPPSGAGAGKTVLERFYDHPLIDSLFRGEYAKISKDKSWRRFSRLPSYIPPAHFAGAVLDLVAPAAPAAGNLKVARFSAIRDALIQSPPGANAIADNPRLKTAILWALDTANGDLDKARAALEGWFNASMEQATSWYMRNTHIWLVFIGFAVSAALNLDALAVTRRLYVDGAFRDAIVKDATAAAQDKEYFTKLGVTFDPQFALSGEGSSACPAPTPSAKDGAPAAKAGAAPVDADGPCAPRHGWSAYETTRAEMDRLGFPIGWSEAPGAALRAAFVGLVSPGPEGRRADAQTVVAALGGWTITAFAVSLGAAFWFQILGRLVSLRLSLRPKEPADAARSASTAPPDAAAPLTIVSGAPQWVIAAAPTPAVSPAPVPPPQ